MTPSTATRKKTTKKTTKPVVKKVPVPTEGITELAGALRRRFKLHGIKATCGAQIQALVTLNDASTVKSVEIGQWREGYHGGSGAINSGVKFDSIADLRNAITTLTKLADTLEAKGGE